MRISDWSSDVCSSDLHREVVAKTICKGNAARREGAGAILQAGEVLRFLCPGVDRSKRRRQQHRGGRGCQAISLEHHPRYLPFMRPAVAGPWLFPVRLAPSPFGDQRARSEEHKSELQSLMRISYAVFCLKKKQVRNTYTKTQPRSH